jgi:uncharacterized PurR-regulated membrane protein YhhQ (DUF165 family)
VSGFEAGVRANSRIGVSRGSLGADADTQRLSPLESIGRAHIGTARENDFGRRIGSAISAVFRLVVPVLLLLTLGGVCLVYADAPIAYLPPGEKTWITLGFALLPLTFLAIHLTNRRYGPGAALSQIVGAWLIALGAMQFAGGDLALLRDGAAVTMREVAGFAGALFLAQLVAVFVFDRMRGPSWWTAPFFATLFAGAVFALAAFPAAYAGGIVDWTGEMLTYLELMIGAAFALLVPYWMLRPLVPPLSGFNGY